MSATISTPRTFKFDSVYVVQFLAPEDQPTGEVLYSEVIAPLAATTNVRAEFFRVVTREEFLHALAAISEVCQSQGHRPILHLETHGNVDGISGHPREFVPWGDLKPFLVRLNEMTQASLLVTLAACHGLRLGATLSTTDRSPLWALIAPDHQVLPSDVIRCFSAFYRRFLTSLNLNQALDAMQAADQSNPVTWKLQSAEVFLAYVFGEFLAQSNQPDLLRRREDEAIAMSLRKRPLTLAQARELREAIRPILRNFPADFHRMKRRFLMLDRFPENEERFPITYEEAINLHAQVKQLITAEAADRL